MNIDIKTLLRESISVKEEILADTSLISAIGKSIDLITRTISKDNFLFFCGNGGSAADAQHISAELTGKLKKDRRPLKGIVLGSNFSSITSISNDYGYDHVFSRELKGLYISKNDILICFSTSGRSKNIIEAIKAANEIGLKSILFSGSRSNEFKSSASIEINVPSNNTPRIQESHITISHIIFQIVEKNLISSSTI